MALPVTVRILLENLLRHAGGGIVDPSDVETLASWRPGVAAEAEIPFMPSRVIMQDLTGVPAVVDLAVMRDAMADLGGDPAKVNPLVPVDLVIDHSVHVDRFGTRDSFAFNVEREYDRNGERYQLLRWAQTSFRNLRIVPPGTGIVHQVNLEFLAPVVDDRDGVAFPDTLVGTDSHTTMINALVCWATASAASRPRPPCSASRSTSRCPTSSGCASPGSCRRAPPPRTSCWSSPRCSAATAWSARSSSSPATGSPACPSPTARRSAT